MSNTVIPLNDMNDNDAPNNQSIHDKQLERLSQLSPVLFSKASYLFAAISFLFGVFYVIVTVDAGHNRTALGLYLRWGQGNFNPVGNDVHFGVLQVITMLAVSMPLVAATFLHRWRPPVTLCTDHVRQADTRKCVPIIWTLCCVLLLLSLIGQQLVNSMDIMQSHRVAFCFFVYVSNLLLLGSTRMIFNYLDHDPNDLVRFGLMYDVQTFVTTFNSIGAMFQNHMFHQYSEFQWPTLSSDTEVNQYLRSLGQTGEEGFVLFYFAFFSSQSVRFVQDGILSTFQASDENKMTAVVSRLSAQYVYGTHEPWSLSVLTVCFCFGAGFLNPHISWIGSFILLAMFFLHRFRVTRLVSDYVSVPSIIVFRLPPHLVAMSSLSLVAMFISLAPLGARFRLMLVANMFLYVAFLVMFFTMRVSQATIHHSAKAHGHVVTLNPVLDQRIGSSARLPTNNNNGPHNRRSSVVRVRWTVADDAATDLESAKKP